MVAEVGVAGTQADDELPKTLLMDRYVVRIVFVHRVVREYQRPAPPPPVALAVLVGRPAQPPAPQFPASAPTARPECARSGYRPSAAIARPRAAWTAEWRGRRPPPMYRPTSRPIAATPGPADRRWGRLASPAGRPQSSCDGWKLSSSIHRRGRHAFLDASMRIAERFLPSRSALRTRGRRPEHRQPRGRDAVTFQPSNPLRPLSVNECRFYGRASV